MAVPDATRKLNLAAALSAVEPCFEDPQVVIGLGLHRPMTEAELEPIASWNPIQHDPDACAPLTKNGIQIGEISQAILDAEWSMSIGVVELHQYAGYSGGHKGVAVGCGGRDTILKLHSRASIMSPGVEVGRINGNPFRQRIEELGEAARCYLALVYVPAAECWVFGDPKAVVRAAASLVDPWEPWSSPVDGVRVRVPASKARTLYQASRAATYLSLSPRPVLRAGGTIVLEANLDEGLGSEEGFRRALTSSSPPWTTFLNDEEPQGAGAQRAVVLALLARQHRLVLCCNDPRPFRTLGIECVQEPPPWPIVEDPFNKLPQLR